MEYTKLHPLVADGRYFEGPRWHAGKLWMVDSLARTVLSVILEGTCATAFEVPGISGGMGFLPNGNPVVTSMFDRKLLTFDNNQLSTLIDLSDIATGTIDDMIIDGSGRIYVGDLGFDLMTGGSHENGKLILVNDGDARIVADGLRFPNGIAVSEDGTRLVVAESDGNCLSDFQIQADGSLERGRRFGEFAEPDGICLDREGAVWVSLYQEDAFVRVDSDGRELDRMAVTGRRAIACVLGGEDRRTLFCISADTSHEDLMRGRSSARVDTVEVEIAGAGFP
jgi:sugar lactone lactonase YvrE